MNKKKIIGSISSVIALGSLVTALVAPTFLTTPYESDTFIKNVVDATPTTKTSEYERDWGFAAPEDVLTYQHHAGVGVNLENGRVNSYFRLSNSNPDIGIFVPKTSERNMPYKLTQELIVGDNFSNGGWREQPDIFFEKSYFLFEFTKTAYAHTLNSFPASLQPTESFHTIFPTKRWESKKSYEIRVEINKDSFKPNNVITYFHRGEVFPNNNSVDYTSVSLKMDSTGNKLRVEMTQDLPKYRGYSDAPYTNYSVKIESTNNNTGLVKFVQPNLKSMYEAMIQAVLTRMWRNIPMKFHLEACYDGYNVFYDAEVLHIIEVAFNLTIEQEHANFLRKDPETVNYWRKLNMDFRNLPRDVRLQMSPQKIPGDIRDRANFSFSWRFDKILSPSRSWEIIQYRAPNIEIDTGLVYRLGFYNFISNKVITKDINDLQLTSEQKIQWLKDKLKILQKEFILSFPEGEDKELLLKKSYLFMENAPILVAGFDNEPFKFYYNFICPPSMTPFQKGADYDDTDTTNIFLTLGSKSLSLDLDGIDSPLRAFNIDIEDKIFDNNTKTLQKHFNQVFNPKTQPNFFSNASAYDKAISLKYNSAVKEFQVESSTYEFSDDFMSIIGSGDTLLLFNSSNIIDNVEAHKIDNFNLDNLEFSNEYMQSVFNNINQEDFKRELFKIFFSDKAGFEKNKITNLKFDTTDPKKIGVDFQLEFLYKDVDLKAFDPVTQAETDDIFKTVKNIKFASSATEWFNFEIDVVNSNENIKDYLQPDYNPWKENSVSVINQLTREEIEAMANNTNTNKLLTTLKTTDEPKIFAQRFEFKLDDNLLTITPILTFYLDNYDVKSKSHFSLQPMTFTVKVNLLQNSKIILNDADKFLEDTKVFGEMAFYNAFSGDSTIIDKNNYKTTPLFEMLYNFTNTESSTRDKVLIVSNDGAATKGYVTKNWNPRNYYIQITFEWIDTYKSLVFRLLNPNIKEQTLTGLNFYEYNDSFDPNSSTTSKWETTIQDSDIGEVDNGLSPTTNSLSPFIFIASLSAGALLAIIVASIAINKSKNKRRKLIDKM